MRYRLMIAAIALDADDDVLLMPDMYDGGPYSDLPLRRARVLHQMLPGTYGFVEIAEPQESAG